MYIIFSYNEGFMLHATLIKMLDEKFKKIISYIHQCIAMFFKKMLKGKYFFKYLKFVIIKKMSYLSFKTMRRTDKYTQL